MEFIGPFPNLVQFAAEIDIAIYISSITSLLK